MVSATELLKYKVSALGLDGKILVLEGLWDVSPVRIARSFSHVQYNQYHLDISVAEYCTPKYSGTPFISILTFTCKLKLHNSPPKFETHKTGSNTDY